MLIFVSLAVGGFLLLVGAYVFGHDHDLDHDADQVSDHGEAGDGEPTVSLFSTKVIFTFVMTFGAGGSIGRFYDLSYPMSSLIGVASGVVGALVMLLALKAIYGQQASSTIVVSETIGLEGTVITTIAKQSLGEVGLTFKGPYRTFMARSSNGSEIKQGTSVKVSKVLGSELIVEELT